MSVVMVIKVIMLVMVVMVIFSSICWASSYFILMCMSVVMMIQVIMLVMIVMVIVVKMFEIITSVLGLKVCNFLW
jgi:hypothetical protein